VYINKSDAFFGQRKNKKSIRLLLIRRWNQSVIKVETSKQCAPQNSLKTCYGLQNSWSHLRDVFSWQRVNMKWTWTIFHVLALTFQSLWMNVLVIYRHLLSADTREDRLLWCSQLNKTLAMLRAWGSKPSSPWFPGYCKSCTSFEIPCCRMPWVSVMLNQHNVQRHVKILFTSIFFKWKTVHWFSGNV
jgi:hypothetical protein